MRYFIYLSYNGKNYHGWQIQPNAITVQETLQEALSLILKQKMEIVAAGRTDTHVHAKMMVAHCDISKEIDTKQIIKNLNSLLPEDIAIQKIIKVKSDAHARFDAISRTYEYHLILEKNPFLKGLAYRHYRNLDFDKMNIAADKMKRYVDFTSFSKLHTDTNTNNCQIYHAGWKKREQEWVFTIQANRFLRDMVRATVGTLLMVGEDKISIDEFCEIIEAKSRQRAGTSISAEGLYLVNIDYPESVFKID